MIAEPEERPAIIERIRKPPEKIQSRQKSQKSDSPETGLIQQIADDMLEPRSNGKPDTMLYEMNDALESMIFRWNFCRSNYAAFFEIEECRERNQKIDSQRMRISETIRRRLMPL